MVHGVNKLPSRPTSALNNRNEGSKNWKAITPVIGHFILNIGEDMSKEQQDLKWPDGYCLDPNGKMIPAAGKEEDFNFGYEMGFLDAWDIMNRAINATHDARIAARIAAETA